MNTRCYRINSGYTSRRIKRAFRMTSLLALLFGLQAGLNLANATTTAAIAAEGYVYGFPIVLMGETREKMTGPERSCTLGADINTFKHVLEKPDERFQAVVRPNVDTLYSSAMLDLSNGPVVLSLPDVQDRYVLFALIDAWSNNFAGLDTAPDETGENSLAGRYLITGPQWHGRVPFGMKHVPAPTNLVWIIGRTEVRSEKDTYRVNELQAQYRLQPLGENRVENADVDCLEDSEMRPPIDVVLDMNGEEFFTRLSQLMKENPPPSDEKGIEILLGAINTGPQARAPVSDLPRYRKRLLDTGISFAQSSIDLAKKALGLGGWGPNPALIPLGDYGKRYFIRAVVAQIGFGANRNEFAVYQNADRDSRSERLHGHNVYTFTLKADDMPDVGAFWSMTAYGEDGFLMDAPYQDSFGINRHALGSNSTLARDDDGNITIYISSMPPEGVPLSNWLPVDEASFQLTLRLYDPGEDILTNEWKAPAVVKQ